MKNDHTIAIRLDTRPISLNLIQVYTPINDIKKEEIDNFYSELQEDIDCVSKREILILMDNVNTKIGDIRKDDRLP